VDRLNKLGVPVKDVPAGFNNIVTLVFDDQDFDMWQLGWRFDSPIPLFLWDLFNSVNATPPNAAAQGGVCSAREDAINGCQQKFDELSNQLLAEQNLDKVNEIAVQLQKMIFDNVAYVETHNLQLTEPFRTDRVAWQGLEKLDGKVANGLQGGNGYLGLAQKK
jgi:ABC-type transport system substrate-binding protein